MVEVSYSSHFKSIHSIFKSEPINCMKLFNDIAFKSDIDEEFQSNIPENMMESYTLFGLIPLAEFVMNDTTTSQQQLWTIELIEEEKLKPQRCGGYGFEWCEEFFNSNENYFKGKNGIVIGSQTPWAEAALLKVGVNYITTIEYQDITSIHPLIEVIKPNKFAERYLSNNFSQVDFIFSFSSLEHDGLGRYGDKLNPFADFETIDRMNCMLKSDGLLFLGIPVGPDSLVWNIHRNYGWIRLQLLLQRWDIVKTFGPFLPINQQQYFTMGFEIIFVLKQKNFINNNNKNDIENEFKNKSEIENEIEDQNGNENENELLSVSNIEKLSMINIPINYLLGFLSKTIVSLKLFTKSDEILLYFTLNQAINLGEITLLFSNKCYSNDNKKKNIYPNIIDNNCIANVGMLAMNRTIYLLHNNHKKINNRITFENINEITIKLQNTYEYFYNRSLDSFNDQRVQLLLASYNNSSIYVRFGDLMNKYVLQYKCNQFCANKLNYKLCFFYVCYEVLLYMKDFIETQTQQLNEWNGLNDFYETFHYFEEIKQLTSITYSNEYLIWMEDIRKYENETIIEASNRHQLSWK